MKKVLWLVEDELRVATGNFLDVVDAKLKTVKGQLISKRHFVLFFNSSKKRTKNFFPSRIEDTKKTFRN